MSIAMEYINVTQVIKNIDTKIMDLQNRRHENQAALAKMETKLAESVGNNIRQRIYPGPEGKVICVTYYPKGDATDSFVGVKVLDLEKQ